MRDPISRDKVGSDAAGYSMSSGLCACTQASTPAQTRCLRPGLYLRDGEFASLAGSQLPPTIEERISGGHGICRAYCPGDERVTFTWRMCLLKRERRPRGHGSFSSGKCEVGVFLL